MPISNNNDINNISAVLETKLPIYLLLLECTILTWYTSLNCPTKNTFALQMLDLIILGWGKGEKVYMAYYCNNSFLSLYHTRKVSGARLPQIFFLNPSSATGEGYPSNFLIY